LVAGGVSSAGVWNLPPVRVLGARVVPRVGGWGRFADPRSR